MKKLFTLVVVATAALFSLAAIAQVITSESLDSLYQGESDYYFEWLLFGLGLLSFMALRREERSE